jgi:glutamate--cysteine ligase
MPAASRSATSSKGKLPALPGEMPTTADWSDHATTAFPEVRLKKFLEMRGADGGPWDRLCALPALFCRLLYDQSRARRRLGPGEGLDAEDARA